MPGVEGEIPAGRSARPFLAGHGIVDSQSQQYYYVGHDFKLDESGKRDYSGCISWNDFHLLADVPCRKLVLLDTCHSGALQPLRSQNLKSAVRVLQEDMVFTLAASAGSEQSAEKKAWRHGAFTKSLLEVLDGKVGDATDPAVTLDEVVRYVRHAVPGPDRRTAESDRGPRRTPPLHESPPDAAGRVEVRS